MKSAKIILFSYSVPIPVLFCWEKVEVYSEQCTVKARCKSRLKTKFTPVTVTPVTLVSDAGTGAAAGPSETSPSAAAAAALAEGPIARSSDEHQELAFSKI